MEQDAGLPPRCRLGLPNGAADHPGVNAPHVVCHYRFERMSCRGKRWPVGSVKDFLFDDRSWKVRWMVVDTGNWLLGRQVLIHPSVIAPLDLGLPVKRVLPMMSMGDALVVSVRLTKQQIEASPEAREDEPVTKQMETDLYDHYGWDPSWGATNFGASAIAAPLIEPLIFSEAAAHTCGGHREPSRRRRSASPKRRLGQRLSCPRNGRRPRPCGEFPCRRRQLGHPLSRRRHAELVAGKACPACAVCGEGHRLVRRSHQCQCHSRSGEIKPGLGPPGHEDQVGEQQLHRHFGWPGYGW